MDNRAEFIDWRNGRYIIVEQDGGNTEFWEREFGGVRWYRFAAPDIIEQAEAIFRRTDALAVAAAARAPCRWLNASAPGP